MKDYVILDSQTRWNIHDPSMHAWNFLINVHQAVVCSSYFSSGTVKFIYIYFYNDMILIRSNDLEFFILKKSNRISEVYQVNIMAATLQSWGATSQKHENKIIAAAFCPLYNPINHSLSFLNLVNLLSSDLFSTLSLSLSLHIYGPHTPK